MNKLTFILDLDNTIFPTRSMDKRVFRPFFEDLTASLKTQFDSGSAENIVKELWEKPIDHVFEKYNVNYDLVSGSFEFFDTVDIHLDIKPYPDYGFFRSFGHTKYLVTTGIKNLQLAKIRALGIENDLDEIFIIDPISDPKPKNIIFRKIKQDHNLEPLCTFVIGDDPDAEIESGNIEKMVTVQILRENTKRGNNADHYIRSFFELADIIPKNNE